MKVSKTMNSMRGLFAAMAAAALVSAAMVAPAFADELEGNLDNDNKAVTQVSFTASDAVISVNVPTTIPATAAARSGDVAITFPTNAKIVNVGSTAVKITSLDVKRQFGVGQNVLAPSPTKYLEMVANQSYTKENGETVTGEGLNDAYYTRVGFGLAADDANGWAINSDRVITEGSITSYSSNSNVFTPVGTDNAEMILNFEGRIYNATKTDTAQDFAKLTWTFAMV